MDKYRFAGFRIIEFPMATLAALRDLGIRLEPHKHEIVAKWVDRQFSTWEPPGISREEVRELFGSLLGNLLGSMIDGKPEQCISDLEGTGTELARKKFPYEALILSLHFLEESYMPFLLNPPSPNTQEWLIRMDEFLHVAIGALATSYFQAYRTDLLAEVEVGRVVQEGLLPHMPTNIGDLEVGYVFVSASERARLGGDFLEVFPIGDHASAFIVGDLSGHGIEAVSDAVMIRSLFKGFISEKPDMVDVFTRMNRFLTSELEGEHFATAMAGIYEPSGRVIFINAGNPPPIIVNGHLRTVEEFALPLGVLNDFPYSVSETQLEPGSCFVAYTDGLSEARADEELFGEKRIQEIVSKMACVSPRALAEHLLDEANRHAKGKLTDDVTVLILKRNGGGSE